MAASAHQTPSSSSSSLPTLISSSSSSSSSTPSASSASIAAPPSVLDLADHLWFYGSVLSLAAFPRLPPAGFFPSPPPDTSTLLAECMRDRGCSSPRPPATSPSLDPDPTTCGFYYLPPPCEDAEHGAYDYRFSSPGEGGNNNDGDDDEDDDGWFRSRPIAGEDEEAFHYYTATSDWDDEEAYQGYLQFSDFEDEPSLDSVEQDPAPAHLQEEHLHFEPQDALSGIYDVATLLKHQHYQEIGKDADSRTAMASSRWQHKSAKQVPGFPQFQVSSCADQADMKENLRAWAHAVALTLPWKAAANVRPLL